MTKSTVPSLEDDEVNELLRKVLRWSIDGSSTSMRETVLVAQFAPTPNDQFYLACELGEAAIVLAAILESGQGNTNLRQKDGSNPLLIAASS
jgi:hypothetical protein